MSSHSPTDETRSAVIDARDAMAFVIIRPAPAGEVDHVSVEAAARGMSKAVAAYVLRQVADRFDAEATAEGDTPITADEIAEQMCAAVAATAVGAGGEHAGNDDEDRAAGDDDDRPWMRP